MLIANSTEKFSKVENRKQLSRFFVLLHIALSCFPLLANASILNNLSVEDLTNDAKEIQIGEVVSKWASPDPDLKMIFTFYKIKVDQTIKGKASKELLLRQPGGMYEDPNTKKTTIQKVFGMEEFQKGEKAIFFIKYTADGAPMMMFQGRRQIVKDKITNKEMAITDTNSPDVEYDNAKSGEEPVVFAKRKPEALESMITRIQNAMSKSR